MNRKRKQCCSVFIQNVQTCQNLKCIKFIDKFTSFTRQTYSIHFCGLTIFGNYSSSIAFVWMKSRRIVVHVQITRCICRIQVLMQTLVTTTASVDSFNFQKTMDLSSPSSVWIKALDGNPGSQVFSQAVYLIQDKVQILPAHLRADHHHPEEVGLVAMLLISNHHTARLHHTLLNCWRHLQAKERSYNFHGFKFLHLQTGSSRGLVQEWKTEDCMLKSHGVFAQH